MGVLVWTDLGLVFRLLELVDGLLGRGHWTGRVMGEWMGYW